MQHNSTQHAATLCCRRVESGRGVQGTHVGPHDGWCLLRGTWHGRSYWWVTSLSNELCLIKMSLCHVGRSHVSQTWVMYHAADTWGLLCGTWHGTSSWWVVSPRNQSCLLRMRHVSSKRVMSSRNESICTSRTADVLSCTLYWWEYIEAWCYGGASISRLLKMIGLFCRISSLS